MTFAFLLLARYVPNVAKEEYIWDQCKKYEYWRPATNDRPTNDRLMAYSHFGRLQMAISQRRVVRLTSCLFLGWAFRGQRIEQRHFRLYLAAIL